jgi:predicted Zn-dependent peptidase
MTSQNYVLSIVGSPNPDEVREAVTALRGKFPLDPGRMKE